MKDEYVLLAAVAVAVYGFYKASTKRVAGYNATPPPTLPDAAPRLVPRMPGVSPTLLEILTEIVDTPGGVLAGPLSPAGYEPDDLKQLVDDIIERRRRPGPPANSPAFTSMAGPATPPATAINSMISPVISTIDRRRPPSRSGSPCSK